MRVFRVFVICMMAASMLLLASCGGEETAAPEQPEKKGENTSVMEATAEETSMEETTGYDTSYTEEEQAKADAAKAAAAKEDITLEQLGSIDASTSYGKQLVSGLGNCQLVKFRVDVGKQAYQEWFDGYMDELADTPASQVTSIQEEMIVMGYSCTVPEAMAGMPEEE